MSPRFDEWVRKAFTYKRLTGGVNFLAVDSQISEDLQRLEFASQINFENFRQGALVSQDGNQQLNPITTDNTKILGFGEFITLTNRYVLYTKASGKVYAFDFDDKTENQINMGQDSAAIPNFVPFNGHIVCFNGADAPWEWDGVVGHATTVLLNTPTAWTTGQPKFGAVLYGYLFAFTANTAYWCDLGNENQWTATGGSHDNGFVTAPFQDVTLLTGARAYGQAIVVFSSLPSAYLITGTTAATFQFLRKEADYSMVSNLAADRMGTTIVFFSGDTIVPVMVTEFGQVRIGDEDADLSRPIKPLFTDDFVFPIDNVNRFAYPVQAIICFYRVKGFLVCYFQSIAASNGQYDICAIFDTIDKCWYFRKASLITAAINWQKSYLFTGTVDGRLLQEFVSSVLYDGMPLTRSFRTPWFQWDVPANKKRLVHAWLWFTSSSVNANIVVNFRVDFDDTIVYTAPLPNTFNGNIAVYDDSSNYDSGVIYAADTDGLLHFPVHAEGRSIQMEVINSDVNSQFTLREFTFEVEFLDTQ